MASELQIHISVISVYPGIPVVPEVALGLRFKFYMVISTVTLENWLSKCRFSKILRELLDFSLLKPAKILSCL